MNDIEVPLSPSKQVVLYFSVIVGVFLSDTVLHQQSGIAFCINSLFGEISFGKFVISAIIAITIMPNIYEKLRVDPNSPFICQIGLFVQNGVFWSVLLSAVGKSI